MHAVICKPFIMQPSDASVAEESLFLLTFLYPGHKCQGHCSVLLWSVVTDSVVCDLISPLMLSVKKPLETELFSFRDRFICFGDTETNNLIVIFVVRLLLHVIFINSTVYGQKI